MSLVLGTACLALAALLSLRQLGVPYPEILTWPAVLGTAGLTLLWQQVRPEPRPARQLRVGRGAAVVGSVLIVVALITFLGIAGVLRPNRDALTVVLAILVAALLLLAPWWATFRAERARAEFAAHLHDSVLQTLALLQKRADDPAAVATLARRQERELRAWLDGGRREGRLAAALEEAAAEVETLHRVPVEVVAVGDAPLDERARALVAAAREAMVNAAKFAGPVALYAEVDPERIEVFVRDRGPGFDPAAVPDDRRGVSESIVGRMERHGGHAVLHTAGGTEWELTL